MPDRIELRKRGVNAEDNSNTRVNDVVFDDFGDNVLNKDTHSISWIWIVVFLTSGCLLYYGVHLNDHCLPSVITKEKAIVFKTMFSGERARDSLRKLTNLGPRLVGDEANEILAPKIIEDEVRDAIQSSHPSQKIHIERQMGSGAFQLGFYPSFTNVYINIQNVLVMIEGSEGDHSVLVNCHYDTVSQTEGASDNGISCAVMLEMIRVLSSSEKRLKHNTVFLFNGAEEAALMGAHLFLQHAWKEKCRVFLNLEAAGSGGRSVLFQSGPKNAWLSNYYSKYAPHPHGLVLIEEMFQSGFIPSDTDFRVFRDFGKLPGMDFAFGRNGHVYHTIYDAEEYIPLGSYQHMGENTLALVKELGNAPELNEMSANADGVNVYFDYLGWFMISYSEGTGVVLNILTILLAIASVLVFIGRLMKWSWLPKYAKLTSYSINKNKPSQSLSYFEVSEQSQIKGGKKTVIIELLIAIITRVFSMGAATGITVFVAFLIKFTAPLAMPWYSNVWIIFPLYWCPFLVTYALIPHLVDIWRSKKHGFSRNIMAQMNLVAALVPMIIVYFAFTCVGIRSAAIFLLPTLSSAVANLIIHLTPLCWTVHKWVWVYLTIHIPSMLWIMYIVLMGYIVFLPIVARMGVIKGDVTVAFVTALFCASLTTFAIPLVTLVRRPSLIFALLSLFSIVTFILILTTSLGLPYTAGPVAPKPQRYWIMHSSREFKNEHGVSRHADSGYFILNMDENSPTTLPAKSKIGMKSLEKDCEVEFYCGVPLFLTRMVNLSPKSHWIPSTPPLQPKQTELLLKNGHRDCKQNKCTLTFVLNGPDRMTLTFAPREGAALLNWTLPTPVVVSGTWQGRPSYFFNIVMGKIVPNYEIALTFEVNSAQLNGDPILDIGLAGNHVHHMNWRTKDFHELLNSLPDWAYAIGWISAYKAYVF